MSAQMPNRKDWQTFLGAFKRVKFEVTDLAITTDGNLGYSRWGNHVGRIGACPLAADS
jgi:hypothetical protein